MSRRSSSAPQDGADNLTHEQAASQDDAAERTDPATEGANLEGLNPPGEQGEHNSGSTGVTVASGTIVGTDGKRYRAGEKAPVRKEDVGRLTDLGFLRAKGAPEPAKQAGPKLSASDGPKISLA